MSTYGQGADDVRGFRAPDELWAKIERIAQSRGCSMGDVVRDALRDLPEPMPAPSERNVCSECGGFAVAWGSDRKRRCYAHYRAQRLAGVTR